MKITKGIIPCAKKVVIYGPEGIGKSTFASQFPDPVFIDTEGSTNSMDVARLPKPTSWQMLLEEIQYVKDHPDVCKTLVIDTVDSGKCNYQDKARTVLTAQKNLVQITGTALFPGDICPELPVISGGSAEIFGMKRRIEQGTKVRNPDGSVNYTEVMLV